MLNTTVKTNDKELAYKYAIDKMKREIEWTGEWDDKLGMIKRSHFGFGSKEYSVSLCQNTDKLEVEIGMDEDRKFIFDTKKIFDDAFQLMKGQVSLF